jgi:hypothetical protein
MGSQQLLLTVLAMVLLGVAIIVGITMFQSNAIESSRSALIDDLLNYAANARAYYWKPTYLGGGGRNFTGATLKIIAGSTENENGEYFIVSSTANELIIGGKGKVLVDNEPVEVHMKINEQTNVIEIVN